MLLVFVKLAVGRLDAVYSNRDRGHMTIEPGGLKNEIRYAGGHQGILYYAGGDTGTHTLQE